MKIIHREKIKPMHMNAGDKIHYKVFEHGWFGIKRTVFEYTTPDFTEACTLTEIIVFEDEFEGKVARGVFSI